MSKKLGVAAGCAGLVLAMALSQTAPTLAYGEPPASAGHRVVRPQAAGEGALVGAVAGAVAGGDACAPVGAAVGAVFGAVFGAVTNIPRNGVGANAVHPIPRDVFNH